MTEIARRVGLRPPVVAILVGALVGVISLVTVSQIVGRITDAERGFCGRLQRERDSNNRNGAIIYVQMMAVAENARAHGHPGSADEYQAIANLPTWEAKTDCARAVGDPKHYAQSDPVPFRLLPKATLGRILKPDGSEP